MEIVLVDNMTRRLLDAISPTIEECKECKIAVAFVSYKGLSLLEAAFRQCLERNGYLEFLIGLDLSGTEPRALWTLYDMTKANTRVRLLCLSEIGPATIYHPKLYVMHVDGLTTVVVGSSNLTEGGLVENIEVNVLIRAGTHEEIVSDIHAVYNKLKFHPYRVEPDQEFLALYERMHSLKREREAISQGGELRKLHSQFKDKVATLHHPVPAPRDLFGWQKLVFERLPEGRFRTSDIYQFEKEFSAYYPENKNVRPKIRQVLQQLRDLGLIKHIERETWVKE
jgi:HKD family nuclease